MVSTLEEKYNKVRRKLCFYLDIEDQELARSFSRRLQDMGLQQECVLSGRVTHAVLSGQGCGSRRPKSRADAMLRRCAATPPPHSYLTLTVQQAISLLDKLYDTFFAAPRKPSVKYSTKEFLKIEFLDKVWRPVFKEFDEWPEFSLEPDPPRDKREKIYTPENHQPNDINQNIAQNTLEQKMTRKSRPRIKQKDEKEPKGGYCEMCNSNYTELSAHRRSAQHSAFVRDTNNFLALDALIAAGADVATFLGKEAISDRRSLRRCNGDVKEEPSPPRNGLIHDDRRHNTRCSKRADDAHKTEDKHYYKVVGVSTKLRSSGGFQTKKEQTKKESPPMCNGSKPLVVKFRKVRRSELSVLSDEAEQFMFPKRASSTSSTSSEDEKQPLSRRRASPMPAMPLPERQRQARPLALKEESSEEDSWPEDKRRRRRRLVAVPRRGRRQLAAGTEQKPSTNADTPLSPEVPATSVTTTTTNTAADTTVPALPVSPLRTEPVQRCMTWENGRLKYTPAVEQLEFAFEAVPRSEPWFDTFTRQDQDKITIRNIPQYFALYRPPTESVKLPYEIGQLPPLKPNCCPLSDLVKRDEKAGPSRSYGTRGKKLQKIRSRAAALQALEAHPRKSPREHASTLAMLGSAGLLRRRPADDTKSTASEDTGVSSDAPPVGDTQQQEDGLQRFLDEVFEEACELDDAEPGGEPLLAVVPDVARLVVASDQADALEHLLRDAVAAPPAPRRHKLRKKNRTGWPTKKKPKKEISRTNSFESESKDWSSVEPDDATQDMHSDETTASSSEPGIAATRSDEDSLHPPTEEIVKCVKSDVKAEAMDVDSSQSKDLECSRLQGNSPVKEEIDNPRRRRRGAGVAAAWLQPVVCVARVDASRRLRSAARRPPR